MSGQALLQLGGGFILLFVGGELLVRGSAALARHLNVSPLFIGATLVAFGTSAPELAVCIDAALSQHGSLALGNVVGSNIANVLLVLGLAGLLSPIVWTPNLVHWDAWVLVGATVAFCVMSAAGGLSSFDGGLLLSLLVTLLVVSYRREDRHASLTSELLKREARELTAHAPRMAIALPSALFGIAGVILGADLLVEGATSVARTLGISEGLIGLTLVAVGTSIPEIATTVVAAYHRKTDIAVGNVLGSNLFNQLGVGGAAALVSPTPLPDESLSLDLWAMCGLMVVCAAAFSLLSRLGRRQALMMLALYAGWVATRF